MYKRGSVLAHLTRPPGGEHDHGADARAARQMVALGWTVVSDYGYSHRSGWTIGICRVRDKYTVELWDGTSLHSVVDSPVAAVRLHREWVTESDPSAPPDLEGQHEPSSYRADQARRSVHSARPTPQPLS